MSGVDIEEIDSFHSPGELARFEAWIEEELKSGYATEIPVLSHYSGVIFRERWIKFYLNGETWRLVYPDGPFHGCWKKVV